MADFTADNVIIMDCDPSELSAFLSPEEIDLLLEPFDEELPLTSRDAKIKAEDVGSFIEAQKKQNTKAATARDIKNVQRWLWENKREPKSLENILPAWLDSYLAELFISIRKSDGTDYEPTSLEAIKNSVDRYLKDKGCTHSLRDRTFHKTQEALKAKKMSLKKDGKGRKANASEPVTRESENKLYETGQMGMKSPGSLQLSVFYHLGKLFGLRGRDEPRNIKYGDVVLRQSGDGTEYLELHERASKTMDGSGKDDYRSTVPRLFAVDGPAEKCPVALFKEFCRRRPEGMTQPDSPMYLTVIPEKRLLQNSLIW